MPHDNTKRFAIQSKRPALEEVAKARPRRGTGAPSRCASHYQAILVLLRERANQGLGILGSELYARPDLYGRSPRNRISELRKDGHLIEGKPSGSSDWFYRLIRDASGANPLPSGDMAETMARVERDDFYSSRGAQPAAPDSVDWFERLTGQKRQARQPPDLGPLFQQGGEQ